MRPANRKACAVPNTATRPGQAQKEHSVNEAHALLDALLHAAIEGVGSSPPATPVEGECWLVGTTPTGAWAGHAGELAAYQLGDWIFATPREGMRILDKEAGQDICFRGGWRRPATPPPPTGGATVDAEARAAIAGLIEVLIAAGILAQS